MKILNVKVTNFGSYPDLEFNFDNQGLCLVSGPTGVGKSTLMDTVTWCLYGCTAKAGSVEDVRSWKAEGEATTGVCRIQLNDKIISTFRVRGLSNKNDLYWTESGSEEPTRGKDLNDTQRLLEARLGLTADQFIASSYLHEFSPVGIFFTSVAKARRALMEGLTDLDLPTRIAYRVSDARKLEKSSLTELHSLSQKLSGKLEQLRDSRVSIEEDSEKWEKDQKTKIKDLEVKAEEYEADKAHRIELERSKHEAWRVGRLKQLSTLEGTAMRLKEIVKDTKQFDLEEAAIRKSLRCGECGSLPDSVNEALIDCRERRAKNTNYNKELQSVLKDIKTVRSEHNPYDISEISENSYISNLNDVLNDINPFDAQCHKLQTMICNTERELQNINYQIDQLEYRISALSHLYDLSFVLRGELLNNAVTELQDSTNAYLEKYFDAELRVGFEMKDSDTLDVVIHKSGYGCNFKQLSRGQRALLKLTFGVSLMKATANQAGQHPNVLFFDECLDALDVDLKVKAVALFEELSTQHDTVMVIDHATEVKASFNKNYIVELVNDESVISEN